jgi:hypothetical protein
MREGSVLAVFAMAILGWFFLTGQLPYSRGSSNQGTLLQQLNKYHIRLKGIHEFRVESRMSLEPRDREILWQARDQNHRLNVQLVKAVSVPEAVAYVHRQRIILQELFQPTMSPYPGVFSDKIGCDEQFQPQIKGEGSNRYLFLFAGERLGYGICNADDIVYICAVIFLYDTKGRQLLKIQYFIPQGESVKVLDDFVAGNSTNLQNITFFD